MLGLALAAWAVWAGAASAQTRAAAPDGRLAPVTLQLKWRHQFQSAGFYAAIAQGYYRDAGLAVSLRVPEAGEDPVEAVREGKATYGVGTADLIIHRAQGAPVVALAAIYQHSPLVLLARRDAGVDTVHDLVGKDVMVEPQAAAILAYLRDEQVPISRLNRVAHQFDPRALIRGDVAAMTAYQTDEPFRLRQAGIRYRIFSPRAAGIDFYGDTLFTTEQEVAEHPDRVRAFRRASMRGWQYALDHPEEIVSLIRREYSQRHSRDHLLYEAERSRSLIAADIVELGYMNPGRWRHIARTYASLGFMTGDVDFDAFLWDRRSERDWAWIYLGMAMATLLVGSVSLVSFRFYRLNHALAAEVRSRQEAHDAMQASEQRYRLLVDATPFPIAISRIEDGRIRFLNPAAGRQFELEPKEAVHHDATEFYADLADRRAFVARLHDNGRVERFETRMRSARGHVFWAELTATRLTYDDEPCAFVAITDISARKDLETSLRHLAETDPLTGLWNRRKFFEFLEVEQSRAKRYGRSGSVLSMDLDHFKAVNDHHGHAAGDAVLVQLARVLRDEFRLSDIIGRIGGEEFAVILPETDSRSAWQAAEKLRAAVEATPIIIQSDQKITMTISLGLARLDGSKEPDSVMLEADEALYRAKHQGRNTIGC